MRVGILLFGIFLCSRLFAESFLDGLKQGILRQDEALLKKAVNTLHVPLQHRAPGVPSANSFEEVKKLASEMDIEPTHPGFVRFLELYRDAPFFFSNTVGRRGYTDTVKQSKFSEELEKNIQALNRPHDRPVFGASNGTDSIILYKDMIFVSGKGAKAQFRRFKHSVMVDSELGSLYMPSAPEQGKGKKILFKNEPIDGWYLHYDSDFFSE